VGMLQPLCTAMLLLLLLPGAAAWCCAAGFRPGATTQGG